MKNISWLLRWTGDPDAGPDVNCEKMPPGELPGGRERHVRDVNAIIFQDISSPVFVNFPTTSPITPDLTPPTSHTHIVKSAMKLPSTHRTADDLWAFKNPSDSRCHLNGPNLTPRTSSDSLSFHGQITRHHSPTLIDSIFPSGLRGVERVHNISSKLPQGFQGAVVDRISGTRSVYVIGLTSASSTTTQIRDIVVRVLDSADEELEADEVVFVLEKHHGRLRELLQGLLYVGGSVIKNQGVDINDGLVLVGIQI